MPDKPATVQYLLQKLHIGGEHKGKYYGRCVPRETLGHQQLAEAIVGLGCLVTEVDVVAVLKALSIIIERELCYGNNITLGDLVNLHMGVKGVFDTPNSSIVAGLQGLEPRATFGAKLRRAVIQKAIAERIPNVSLNPVIVSYADSANGLGTHFTPGAIATIRGRNLNFSPMGPSEGVFFIDNTDPTIIRRVELYASIKKTAVSFLVPEMTHNNRPHRIEVRCIIPLEETEIRIGSTPFALYHNNLPREMLSLKTPTFGDHPNVKAKAKLAQQDAKTQAMKDGKMKKK